MSGCPACGADVWARMRRALQDHADTLVRFPGMGVCPVCGMPRVRTRKSVQEPQLGVKTVIVPRRYSAKPKRKKSRRRNRRPGTVILQGGAFESNRRRH